MIIGISGVTEDPQGNRGSKAAGKSEVAKHLVEKHGFVEVALADEIKRITMRLWDFSEEQLWGPSELRDIPDKRCPLKGAAPGSIGDPCGFQEEDRRFIEDIGGVAYLTPRHALQQIGTEVARAIDPDVWVRFTMKVAKELLADPKYLMYSRTEGVVPTIEQSAMGEWRRDDAPEQSTRGIVIPDVRFPNEVEGIRAVGGKVWRKKRELPEVEPSTHASEVSLLSWDDAAFDAALPGGDLDLLGLRIDSLIDAYSGRMRPYDPAQEDIPPFQRE